MSRVRNYLSNMLQQFLDTSLSHTHFEFNQHKSDVSKCKPEGNQSSCAEDATLEHSIHMYFPITRSELHSVSK
jgi:hypothetical protein